MDVRQFIHDKFGSQEALLRDLEDAGHDKATMHGIRKWIERGQIPGAWLTRMLVLLETRGEQPEITKYQGAK